MDIEKIRESLKGCGNHGCIVKKPVGLGTNGSCKCSSDRLTMERLVAVLKFDLKSLSYKLSNPQPTSEYVLESETLTYPE